MVRKTSKRPTKRKKRTVKKKQKFSDRPMFAVGVLVLLLLIVALFAYFFSMDDAPAATQSDVVATVNGKQLLRADLEFQYNLLPEQFRQQLSQDAVLEQIINEELVMQKAIESGITITPEDINVRVQEILTEGGLTVQDLQKNLDNFGVSMEQFEDLVERQLLIQAYTGEHLVVSPPSDADLMAFYETRKEEYAFPEQVTVRHILISNQRTDAAVIAKDLLERARAGEDFCALVLNTTDDKGSKDTCGEYTFPRGFMVPEFEKISFEMKPGDFQLVPTEFGYHVISKIKDLPAGATPFEDVKATLAEQYESYEFSILYQVLLSELRDEATIVYPGDSDFVPVETPAEAPPVEDTPVEVAPPVEDVPVEVLAEEPEEAPVEVPEPPVEAPTNDLSTLECIADEAILYGTSWSTDTNNAREMFADVSDFKYIACDVDADACDSKGVAAYPTWIIGDLQFLGRMSLPELQQATGCE